MEITTNQSPPINTQHQVFGGRAYIYRRDRSPYWQAAAFVGGHNYRASTKEEDLSNAISAAEEWYITLRGQAATGTLPSADKPLHEPTFREVAEQFIQEYSVITEGQRSPRWV